jgi:hypothetical protein
VAAALRCAVDAVEEDDAFVLFSASDETVSDRGLDWAVELAWSWAAAGLLWPATVLVQVSLPLFLFFKFLFIFSVLYFVVRTQI